MLVLVGFEAKKMGQHLHGPGKDFWMAPHPSKSDLSPEILTLETKKNKTPGIVRGAVKVVVSYECRIYQKYLWKFCDCYDDSTCSCTSCTQPQKSSKILRTGATGATGACHHAPSNLNRVLCREKGGKQNLTVDQWTMVLPNFNCPKFQLQGIKIAVEIHSWIIPNWWTSRIFDQQFSSHVYFRYNPNGRFLQPSRAAIFGPYGIPDRSIQWHTGGWWTFAQTTLSNT